MTAVGAFTIDLYLPAFPSMQRELHASSGLVQLTLTGMLAGLAIGQLVVGPLSDALGRRRPLLIGLCVHLVASLACAAAPNIEVLAVLRVCQGAGVAASSVVALAIVRDRFDGYGASRLIARLMIIIGVSPIFAPTIGSALLPVTGWRGIFLVLGAISLSLGVVVAWVLPETLPVERRRAWGLRPTFGAYREVLSDRPTVWLVAMAGMSMAGLFGYAAGSSFVYQDQYHLSSEAYGLIFALGGSCLIVGSQVSGSLVHRFAPQTLLTCSLSGSSTFAVILLIDAVAGLGGLAGIVVPVCLLLASFGVAQPTAPSIALERHPGAAGTTAAVLGATQFGVAAVAAPTVSLFPVVPAVGMAIVIATGVGTAATLFFCLVRPGLRRTPAPHLRAVAVDPAPTLLASAALGGIGPTVDVPAGEPACCGASPGVAGTGSLA